ncbi:MAG: insulinase family protein [Cytophagales bacterium]|nr:insulinase family protein [Cytophagales bacterium]
MIDYELFTLPNGIRIVHKQITNSKVAHCGFVLDIGSRDEAEDQQGLAHFWEHMAFKGTQKRKSYHIINRLESVGGDLNAYTTKEKIYFYASILENHYERAFELLTDITFHSSFPLKEIEKEKGVILEEMSMYEDAPEDDIIDQFDILAFDGHSLGRNILGTQESVKNTKREDFIRFIKENLNTERIIFSSVGNIPFAKVKKWAEKYLGDIPRTTPTISRTVFEGYQPKVKEVKRPITQAHCMMGAPAFSVTDDKRLPFFMLSSLLGGPMMSSRLNMSLREKYGYVYSVESIYASYTDTGMFGVYFGTESKHLKKSLSLVHKELQKIKDKPLGTIQLSTLKQQLLAQLAMGEESNVSMMQMMGKSLLDLGRIDELTTIFDQINNVTAEELRDLANEVFDFEKFTYLTYLPSS